MRAAARGAAASLLLAMASMLALASPAPANPGSCDGVWVVVDASAAGGSLQTRCAPGDPSSGLDALDQAGFSSTFAPRIPGFVCTIDARPDPCNGAPADAYWSYWHADPGGSWTYATTGAGSRDPAPGAVEGWRFGDGSKPPGTAPPANAPAPEPAPEPEPAPAPEPETPSEPTDDTPSETGSDDRVGSDDGPAAPSSSDGDRDRERTGDTASRSDAPASGETSGDSDPDVAEAGDTTEPNPQEASGEAEEAPGPSWEPPEVEIGEWPDPPPPDPITSDPAPAPSPPARRTSQVRPTSTDEDGMALATARDAEPPTPPVGAALAVGLLGGLGVLTWRQHQRRRSGAST